MNLEKLNLQELDAQEIINIDGGVNGNEMTREEAKAIAKAVSNTAHQILDFLRGFTEGLG